MFQTTNQLQYIINSVSFCKCPKRRPLFRPPHRTPGDLVPGSLRLGVLSRGGPRVGTVPGLVRHQGVEGRREICAESILIGG